VVADFLLLDTRKLTCGHFHQPNPINGAIPQIPVNWASSQRAGTDVSMLEKLNTRRSLISAFREYTSRQIDD